MFDYSRFLVALFLEVLGLYSVECYGFLIMVFDCILVLSGGYECCGLY